MRNKQAVKQFGFTFAGLLAFALSATMLGSATGNSGKCIANKCGEEAISFAQQKVTAKEAPTGTTIVKPTKTDPTENKSPTADSKQPSALSVADTRATGSCSGAAAQKPNRCAACGPCENRVRERRNKCYQSCQGLASAEAARQCSNNCSTANDENKECRSECRGCASGAQ